MILAVTVRGAAAEPLAIYHESQLGQALKVGRRRVRGDGLEPVLATKGLQHANKLFVGALDAVLQLAGDGPLPKQPDSVQGNDECLGPVAVVHQPRAEIAERRGRRCVLAAPS